MQEDFFVPASLSTVTTTILSFLFLLAIGQGLFLAAALLSARQGEVKAANRLLSALLLACTAIIGHAWLGVHHLYLAYPHSALAIATLGLLVGPLLYLYLGSMLFNRPLTLLATLALLPFYLQSGAAKAAWMLRHSAPPWYLLLAASAKIVVFSTYIVVCFRLVGRARAGALAAGLARLMQVWLVGGLLSAAALLVEYLEPDLPISADAIGALGLMCFVYATAWLASKNANIVLATDTPSSPTFGNLPGLNGNLELRRMHAAGMSLAQAFKAATINNARTFKLDARVATIEKGKNADLLLMRTSPLQDIAAYDSVVTLWVGGKQVARAQLAAGE